MLPRAYLLATPASRSRQPLCSAAKTPAQQQVCLPQDKPGMRHTADRVDAPAARTIQRVRAAWFAPPASWRKQPAR